MDITGIIHVYIHLYGLQKVTNVTIITQPVHICIFCDGKYKPFWSLYILIVFFHYFVISIGGQIQPSIYHHYKNRLDFYLLFQAIMTMQRLYGDFSNFHRWRKTSCAPPCIISDTSGHRSRTTKLNVP